MFWCVTVPRPMFGSHIDGARSSRRVGSRYRYCLVSAATLPGAVSSGGMYDSAARSEYPRTRRRRAEAGGAAGASAVTGAGFRATVVTLGPASVIVIPHPSRAAALATPHALW